MHFWFQPLCQSAYDGKAQIRFVAALQTVFATQLEPAGAPQRKAKKTLGLGYLVQNFAKKSVLCLIVDSLINNFPHILDLHKTQL